MEASPILQDSSLLKISEPDQQLRDKNYPTLDQEP